MDIILCILINLGVLLVMGIILFQKFKKRESRLLDSLKTMLEDAINGKFEEKRLDETKLSALENAMQRFLLDREVSKDNLTKQKEMIQRLVSDIAHQTITPLSNISLYAQLLEEKEIASSKEILAIQDESSKLEFLIQSLVKLSRLEAGIITVHAKKESLNQLLKSIKFLFQEKAEQKKIHFLVEESTLFANFDLKWTLEAIGNIVDNAIKYTKDGGRIKISTTSYSFFTRINVTDNGIGIKEEDQAKIFHRFYRAFEVHEAPGVGIGLYLTREIISKQNGYLKVVSETGKGSVFSIFLPASEISQNCDNSETTW